MLAATSIVVLPMAASVALSQDVDQQLPKFESRFSDRKADDSGPNKPAGPRRQIENREKQTSRTLKRASLEQRMDRIEALLEALIKQQASPRFSTPPSQQPHPLEPTGRRVGGTKPESSMDEPSDDEVMRALEIVRPKQGGLHELQLNNVRIVKEKVADYIDPPRFIPLVGPAQLHHARYKCTVYFDETLRVSWPIPHTLRNEDAVEVLYIDHNHVHRVGPSSDLPAVPN